MRYIIIATYLVVVQRKTIFLCLFFINFHMILILYLAKNWTFWQFKKGNGVSLRGKRNNFNAVYRAVATKQFQASPLQRNTLPPLPTYLLLSIWFVNFPIGMMAFEKKHFEIAKNYNIVSHILVKRYGKTVLIQNPGQPMGWLGWPVATALFFSNIVFLQ